MRDYQNRIKRSTRERLVKAIEKDPEIVAYPSNIETHVGSTEEYLFSLGFKLGDLLRLERFGYAVRGYLPGKSGHGQRWVLLSKTDNVEVKGA